MKKEKRRILALLLAAALAAGALTGCGSTSTTVNAQGGDASADSSEQDVITLNVAYRNPDTPWTYQDADGTPAGFNVEVFNLIGEYLPGYAFNYIAASRDDFSVGLSTGDYDIGVANSGYSESRAETYTFPQDFYGAYQVCVIVRNEDADGISTLEDVVAKGLTCTPRPAGDGVTFLIEQWNEANPDNQIEFEYIDNNAVRTEFEDVATGKYGWALLLESNWEQQVVAEDGVYHQYLDDLTCIFVLAAKAYPMLSKVTVGADEEFVAALTDAITAAKEDPRFAEISEKYLGENILDWPFTEGW